jgi:hypothetical protein
VNPNSVVVSVAGTVTLLIVMLPHVLNAPSAKSFNCAETDADDRVWAMNPEMHASPDNPSSFDTFTPPSKKACPGKFTPVPVFGMNRHGAVVAPAFTIAHARSPAGNVGEHVAVVEANSSCNGLFAVQAGSVRK